MCNELVRSARQKPDNSRESFDAFAQSLIELRKAAGPGRKKGRRKTVDELEAWLSPFGLAHLAPTLRANDIDLDILPALSEADLEKLGLSLGHRRKLLRAIEDLARLPSSPTKSSAEPAPSPLSSTAAERRQLTVMFCDLVGSTALSRRLDPEDLGEVIRGYQDVMSGVVAQHGGYVANFLGDGIIAYFGWPRADEDEATQAIRAGLEAVETARRLPCGNGDPLQVRVGIASGNVVVGDVETAGRRQPGAIAGDTPNLAARLQALADANQVVIDELTRQLVGVGFLFEELGPQALKGFAEPVLPRGCWPSGPPKADSRRAKVGLRRSSAASTRRRCLWSGSSVRRQGKARPCCCRAKPGSANRASFKR
jgi:class 3 adenylate cyclase